MRLAQPGHVAVGHREHELHEGDGPGVGDRLPPSGEAGGCRVVPRRVADDGADAHQRGEELCLELVVVWHHRPHPLVEDREERLVPVGEGTSGVETPQHGEEPGYE